MKSLLWHVRNFEIEITSLANRPMGIEVENVKEKIVRKKDAVLAFITVEEKDKDESAKKISEEIIKMANDVGVSELIVCPFAHLSNNLADSKKSLDILNRVADECAKGKFTMTRVHFGSDKELLLGVYGHKGAVRFREV